MAAKRGERRDADSADTEEKRGRPTLYREDYPEQARKLCLLGATDAELGDFFGVSEQTINAWKKEFPEFLESITRGKLLADAEVAEKLYHRALGYSHPAVKMFQAGGEIIRADYTEHYPPDTQAASLWLRNRQKDKWRDKQDHEVTGKDGGDIVVSATVALPGLDALMVKFDETLGGE